MARRLEALLAGKDKKGSEPERAGDVARRLIRGKIGRRRKKEARIVSAWRDIVGEERASKMFPLRLRAGVLWVEVSSPALYFEAAQFGREEMLAKVRAAAPDLEIKEIRFKLG